MSIMGRRVPLPVILLIAFALVVGTLIPVMTRAQVREIHLVARGMAFYVQGSATPNPTIEVTPGERVRIVLHNEDPGISHDFASPAISAAMDAIRQGERGELTLSVPTEPGTYEYWCRPHRPMMRGLIRVVAD